MAAAPAPFIDRHDLERIRPVKRIVERDFLRRPGVVGVDIDFKRVGGEPTGEPAIVVFVERKGDVPADQAIPPSIHGIRTDVVEAKNHLLASLPVQQVPDAETDAMVLGASSAFPSRYGAAGYGTLACLVQDASGKRYFLSNYHVLCVEPNWNDPGVDRSICAPAIEKGGDPVRDRLGVTTQGFVQNVSWKILWSYGMDAAITDVSGVDTVGAGVSRIGSISSATWGYMGWFVQKNGAATGRTNGQILSEDFSVNMTYPGLGTITLLNCMRISPIGAPRFLDFGDSGSLLVGSQNDAVGLNFAKTVAADGREWGVACAILPVLSALGVSIVPGYGALGPR